MNTRTYFILISTLIVCGLLAFIEHGIEINYLIKTAAKAGLFFLTILTYIKLFKDFHFKDAINIYRMNRNEWFRVLLLGVISASIVLIAYKLLHSYIDVSIIKNDLTERLGITPTGFIFVGMYITFGNSFLEEYYFRGFIFFNLSRKLGYIFSPIIFASYHIPMIMLWFSPILIVLCFLGLWAIGMIFHKVNERNRTIWSSWIIHICADIMIILIGYSIFY